MVHNDVAIFNVNVLNFPHHHRRRLLLHRTARKTWRYYETFVTAADGWLPPDNYQEVPEPRLARRTSPTNVGVYLLQQVCPGLDQRRVCGVGRDGRRRRPWQLFAGFSLPA